MELNFYVCGSKNVGKSAFIERFSTGKFPASNTTKNTNEVFRAFNTSIGNIPINFIKNITNQNTVDGIILLFSFDSIGSYVGLQNKLKNLQKKYPNTPIVVCGNKVDLASMKDIQRLKINRPYFSVSAKSMYGIEKPILFLIRKFFNDNSIKF